MTKSLLDLRLRKQGNSTKLVCACNSLILLCDVEYLPIIAVDAVDVVFDAAAAVADAAQPAQDFLSSKFMATVEAKVNSFAEDIPWLMNVLDEVTALHPVITGRMIQLVT